MHRTLIHLYGPFAINSFGLLIVVGLVVFSALVLSDPRRAKIISTDCYFNGLALAIFAGLVGGRSLYILTNWQSFSSWIQMLAIWHGGFSLLGALIACTLTLPAYLKKHSINIIAVFDLVATYAPLLQSISRIGCFFAGCCFGIPTTYNFSTIILGCPIGLNNKLHPTQLYSSLALLSIFLLFYFILQKYLNKPGQLTCAYLFFMGLERFIIDFWRGDRELLPVIPIVSVAQLLGATIALTGLTSFIFITFLKKRMRYESL